MSIEAKTSNLRAGNLRHADICIGEEIQDLSRNCRALGRATTGEPGEPGYPGDAPCRVRNEVLVSRANPATGVEAAEFVEDDAIGFGFPVITDGIREYRPSQPVARARQLAPK